MRQQKPEGLETRTSTAQVSHIREEEQETAAKRYKIIPFLHSTTKEQSSLEDSRGYKDITTNPFSRLFLSRNVNHKYISFSIYLPFINILTFFLQAAGIALTTLTHLFQQLD